MSSFRSRLLLTTGSLLTTLWAGAQADLHAQESTLAADTANTAEIVHVLNRTSFGIRPGDVEAVQQMGLQAYLQQQLHPETIDDSATDQAVAQLSLMALSDSDLWSMNQQWTAHRDQQLKRAARIEAAAAAAGFTINASPAVTALVAAMAKNKPSGAAAPNPPPVGAASMPPANVAAASAPAPMNGGMGMEATGMMNSGGNGATAADNAPIVITSAAQAQAEVTALLNHDEGPLPTDPLARKKEVLRRAEEFTPNLPAQQIQQAKLVRAVDSKRQLQEVLVDFWSNHFNVDTRKDDVRIFIVGYDRAIRDHIWGSFRDLLEATAKSPAMLLYLDNASNISPNIVPKNPQQAKQLRRQGGLNENYGREIMELHSLGVDAGYTQKDVQEVARCFTGWTFDRKTGAFIFKPEFHDNGSKVVLGHVIPPNGGMQDGETVLDILCSSPHCAHFISRELCQRFVSDDPPSALVNRIAEVFTQTKGDLRAVTQAILTSPEFLSPASFGNKIKSPEEFAISAVRASGSTIIPDLHPDLIAAVAAAANPPAAAHPHPGAIRHFTRGGGRTALRGAIAQMGEPLYNCNPPTGYKEVSSTWMNPGALIGRLNFAVALAETNVGDVGFDAQKVIGDIDLDQPDAVLDRCVSVLLQNHISDSTRKVLKETAVPDPGVGKTINPSKLIALVLGSPEFQRK